MKSKSRDLKHPGPTKSAPLGHVLRQSETIKDAVAQAAGELVSVNETLKQDSNSNAPAQAINEAIAQNVNVERKVAKAADDLNQVNTQLTDQVAEQADMASELAEAKQVNTELVEKVAEQAGIASELAEAKQVNTQLADQVAEQAGVASELADAISYLTQVRNDLSKSQTHERDARQHESPRR